MKNAYFMTWNSRRKNKTLGYKQYLWESNENVLQEKVLQRENMSIFHWQNGLQFVPKPVNYNE
jgi:hypothetical protein